MQYPIIDTIVDAYQRNEWTGLNLVDGKNLFNVDSIEHWNVSPSNPDFLRWGNKFTTPGTYTVSAQRAVGFMYCRIFHPDNTIDTYFIVTSDQINNTTFTINEGEYFYVYDALDVTKEASISNFNRWMSQVELGTEVTPYEPYVPPTTDITHRLKLPLPHYFPHPVIDALQRAAAGTQTADDTEILRHYLTPLGIGGI